MSVIPEITTQIELSKAGTAKKQLPTNRKSSPNEATEKKLKVFQTGPINTDAKTFSPNPWESKRSKSHQVSKTVKRCEREY